jgi:hypothetical protein
VADARHAFCVPLLLLPLGEVERAYLCLPCVQFHELIINVLLQASQLSVTKRQLACMARLCCLALKQQLKHLQQQQQQQHRAHVVRQ